MEDLASEIDEGFYTDKLMIIKYFYNYALPEIGELLNGLSQKMFCSLTLVINFVH